MKTSVNSRENQTCEAYVDPFTSLPTFKVRIRSSELAIKWRCMSLKKSQKDKPLKTRGKKKKTSAYPSRSGHVQNTRKLLRTQRQSSLAYQILSCY